MRKVEILTKADTTAVIELSDVKTRLGITVSTTDTELTDIINELTSEVENYLGRPMAYQQYRETWQGHGLDRVLLRRMPVERNSVTVTISGTADTLDTDFYIEDGGILYRPALWVKDTDPNTVITYWAGWLMPGVVTAWAVNTGVVAGEWYKPSARSLSPMLFKAGGAGTTDAATEPTWPTTAAGTVVDNDITWTAHEVEELPDLIRGLAFVAVKDRFLSRRQDSNLKAERGGFFGEEYESSASQGAAGAIGSLPLNVRRALDSYRVAA